MQRVQKQGSESENAQRTAQAKFTSWSRENERANAIDDSPAMVAQRKKLNSLFGGAIQRVEDEEPLQGKFETAQRVEEEEPLQGKFDAVQRVEEEEPLQGKFEAVQRVEEEEPLQGKFEVVQRVEEEEPLQGKFDAASSTQLKEEVAKPNNTGLPDNLKSGIESLSGMSMDNVKVHYNSSQPAQLNALAYAQGTDIHVAPGQEQHLPHEAWHVVQQAQGRVMPTMQMKEGVPVNDDQSLEHEASVMGERAVGLGTSHLKEGAQRVTGSLSAVSQAFQSVQRVIQRATNIQYNNNAVPAGTQINDIQHNRVGVNDAAITWVLNNGEASAVPRNTVCNHSRAYQTIWQQLHGQLVGGTVANASNILLTRFGNLGIGGNPGNNQNILQNAVLGNANAPNDLNNAFNYYIYKIGDYPDNLFYWPDRTGGNPDSPQTVYSTQNPLPLNTTALPQGWTFRNPGKGDAQRLADEQNRVAGGAGDLMGQGL